MVGITTPWPGKDTSAQRRANVLHLPQLPIAGVFECLNVTTEPQGLVNWPPIWHDTLNPMYGLLILTLVQRLKGQEPVCVTWGKATWISDSYSWKGYVSQDFSEPLPSQCPPLCCTERVHSIPTLIPWIFKSQLTCPTMSSLPPHSHTQISDTTAFLYPVLVRILLKSLFTHLVIFCRLKLVAFSLWCFSITPLTDIY